MTRAAEATTLPTFAIVVPTHNEADDIGSTCEALLELAPAPDEIIFVDDASTDDTVNMIRRHVVRPSVRLIVQSSNRGPATARNVGVRAATSDVIVFVDADVLLPSDFLARVSRHYQQGADCVAVDAEVPDTEAVCERFFQAQHESLYGADRDVGWSQAFSCRRSVAIQAGLFPEALPGPGGEDGEFVRRLSACTSNSVMDRTIVVRHTIPKTLSDFWRQWQGRGVAVPFLRHRVHRVPWPRLVAERTAASVWSLFQVLTIIPMARRAVALASLSERRWRDLLPFFGLSVVQLFAHRIGEWKGMWRLYHAGRSHAR